MTGSSMVTLRWSGTALAVVGLVLVSLTARATDDQPAHKGKLPYVPSIPGDNKARQCCVPAHADVPAYPAGVSVSGDWRRSDCWRDWDGDCYSQQSLCVSPEAGTYLVAFKGYCRGMEQAGECGRDATQVAEIRCLKGQWMCCNSLPGHPGQCLCYWFAIEPRQATTATNVEQCSGTSCPAS